MAQRRPRHSGTGISQSWRGFLAVTATVCAAVFSSGTMALADAADPGDPGSVPSSELATPASSSAEVLALSAPQSGADQTDLDQAVPPNEEDSESAEVLPVENDSTAETPAETTSPDPAEVADPPVESGDQDADQESQELDQPQSGAEVASISPMALPSTPYLTWKVTDSDNALLGGATFKLNGPRGNGGWPGTETTVVDCVSGTCAGPDLDNTPGVFAVKTLQPNHTVSTSSRYRLQPVSAPAGLTFAGDADWNEIDGRGSNPSSGEWSGGVHDFGTYQATSASPSCGAGYIYSVSGSGQMYQVNPSGQVSPMGTAADDVSYFNGLGIGAGGSKVFAISRNTSSGYNVSGTVWKYDTDTGTWASTGVTQSTNTNLVGGAVCLSCGTYFFGGFTDGGGQFRIWAYNEATNTVSARGYVDTSEGAASSNNGDMAFDREGNLYVVRGAGSDISVYSVTAADLSNSGPNTRLNASRSEPSYSGMSNVNGAALDASGKLFLGDSSNLTSYNMPDMTGAQTVTSHLASSADLASCSSPPTVVIEKELPNGRVNPDDQFALSMSQGDHLIGTATTSGTAIGVQDQRVGPLPANRGVDLTFAETFINGADPSQYATSWKCNLDGNTVPYASGTGTAGVINIPYEGERMVCRFVNTPLVAHVNVTKQVLDEDGNDDPTSRANWAMTLTDSAVTGNVRHNPLPDVQSTNTGGQTSWDLYFDSSGDAATVQLAETQQEHYRFVSGQCVVTDINGVPGIPQVFQSEEGSEISPVHPGETVDCTFVNQRISQTLTLTKSVENNFGGQLEPDDFTLTATPLDPAGTPLEFASGETMEIDPGTYQIGEVAQPGYELSGIACAVGDGQPVALIDGQLVIGPDDTHVACTLTNNDQPASVTWGKVAAGTDQFLSGSSWTLTGPTGTSSATVQVEDCEAGPCTGPDQDPRPGRFQVNNLKWGAYQLVEATAPAGFIKDDTVHQIDLGPTNLAVDLGNFDNELREGPVLPITGGFGTDTYLLGGGLVAGLGAMIAAAYYSRHPNRLRSSGRRAGTK